MRKIHFYKAKTRLGILYRAIHQKTLNVGVEKAPDAILTKDFLSKFKCTVSEFVFPKPEDISKESYLNILSNKLTEFKILINKTIEHNETQAVIGGDNSVTFCSVLALLERVDDSKRVGYIQFDSHGEMNLYKTSPTKNFHGMYLRPFIDNFDIPEIKKLVNFKLPTQNLLFIGDLKLDAEEKRFFIKSKFTNLNRRDVLKNKKDAYRKIEDFIDKFEYIHVNFDVDVFNEKEVLATGIPSKDGFMLEDLLPILKIVSKHPNLSLDLSEVNPKKIGAEKTIQIAQKLLSTLLSPRIVG
jgi:arginase family enzyme